MHTKSPSKIHPRIIILPGYPLQTFSSYNRQEYFARSETEPKFAPCSNLYRDEKTKRDTLGYNCKRREDRRRKCRSFVKPEGICNKHDEVESSIMPSNASN